MHNVPKNRFKPIKGRQMNPEGNTSACKVFVKSWNQILSRSGNKFWKVPSFRRNVILNSSEQKLNFC